ncbi:Golgin candidate 2 [Carex littledalei]|uniref:Golgin candidate 2 n=1 Tax=Carex littledalei TaxID=544730 RepID=A0A833VRR0_9POAL|nr:Golgin candidate 2 [Carex littledalei]
MAHWISSKIKAAENLLQHIDQQAAESLGKTDQPGPPSGPQVFANDVPDPTKQVVTDPKSINLPRKKPSLSKLLPQKSPIVSGNISGNSSRVASPSNLTVTATDSADADWTEILSTPSKPIKREMVTNVRGQSRAGTVKREKDSKGEKREDTKKAAESGSESENESDSDSSYDSEEEKRKREERRRRKEEKLAQLAAKAIREKEELVARMEGEKRSLERVLQEREREQAQQATQLLVNTTETIEAVELEKKRHNSTRMEALSRVAKLEAVNAELSKLLATTQWNLELEVKRVAQLREQIESKEHAQKEYRRKMSKIQARSSSRDESKSMTKFKLELIDAEYSLVVDKVARLQDKVRSIEENINMTKMEMENQTEMETELEKRLDQLSDRLIQKQSQVEALSSEKATLLLRIEMVSRLLDGTNSTDHLIDIESGTASTQAYPVRERTGDLQLGSVIHQLDSILSAGLPFLRRNPKALISALVYVAILHIWVMYIIFSK